MLDLIMENFELRGQDVRSYSPLTLAYIGDAVYELVIRTLVVEQGNRSVNKLNNMTIACVKAGAQARMMELLREELTEEETDVYKRGRNAKPATRAKNASMGDYHRATGFEALMGYLYLTGRNERMLELIRRGRELVREEDARE